MRHINERGIEIVKVFEGISLRPYKWTQRRERRTCGSQTVLHFHRLLHRALSQAVKWQLLAPNPVDAVEPPRPQRQEMNAINEADTALLLDKLAGSSLFSPVLFAITIGHRRGEVLALRWKDVNLVEGRIIVNQSLE